jgi:hypothetical protein
MTHTYYTTQTHFITHTCILIDQCSPFLLIPLTLQRAQHTRV